MIKEALQEDRAWHDVTSRSFLPRDFSIRVHVLFKGKQGVFCGGDIFKEVFRAFDPKVKVTFLVRDGTSLKKSQVVARLSGPSQSILAAERTALNFLGLLTGISTATHYFVQAAKKCRARFVISETRKTHPLLRDLEKHAVLVGGGQPHRRDLSSMVLLKDNHLRVLRRFHEKKLTGFLIRRVCAVKREGILCEIEAQSLEELKEALPSQPDWVMLDNMNLLDLRKAVNLIYQLAPKTKIEVSGGISLADIPKLAKLPIHRVSVGAIVHSASFADFSLEVGGLEQ